MVGITDGGIEWYAGVMVGPNSEGPQSNYKGKKMSALRALGGLEVDWYAGVNPLIGDSIESVISNIARVRIEGGKHKRGFPSTSKDPSLRTSKLLRSYFVEEEEVESRLGELTSRQRGRLYQALRGAKVGNPESAGRARMEALDLFGQDVYTGLDGFLTSEAHNLIYGTQFTTRGDLIRDTRDWSDRFGTPRRPYLKH